MAKILKGSDVVEFINNEAAKKADELKAGGVTPNLAILRVGEKADQISYEKSAVKRCETIGVNVKNVILSEDASQSDVLEAIAGLNNDNTVHGVLILRPLPKHISDEAVRSALCASKDIDGITDGSLAGVFTGQAPGKTAGFPPCTAQACIDILEFYKIDCTGKKVAVVGRSLVVGKPVAIMLMGKNATVTVCHTRTVDVASITREADIIIAASGQMESLTGEYFSPGQTVIDVGINWNDKKGKLCGDVLFEDAEPIVEAITPVPGGVGTVTTSVLVSNVIKAAERNRKD